VFHFIYHLQLDTEIQQNQQAAKWLTSKKGITLLYLEVELYLSLVTQSGCPHWTVCHRFQLLFTLYYHGSKAIFSSN